MTEDGSGADNVKVRGSENGRREEPAGLCPPFAATIAAVVRLIAEMAVTLPFQCLSVSSWRSNFVEMFSRNIAGGLKYTSQSKF